MIAGNKKTENVFISSFENVTDNTIIGIIEKTIIIAVTAKFLL